LFEDNVHGANKNVRLHYILEGGSYVRMYVRMCDILDVYEMHTVRSDVCGIVGMSFQVK
jgi:hypothetical protein